MVNRRRFSQSLLALSGAPAADDFYQEPARKLPVRKFDVVVAGGGTAGVVAAIAAARQGAKTALIEAKGYPGGTVVEGGTALHSFYNLWKAFPGVAKRQVVRGIPQEIVDRLAKVGGTSGHAEMAKGYDYDSVCTAIDTEIYKLVAFEMLAEAGVGDLRQHAARGRHPGRLAREGRDRREPLGARGLPGARRSWIAPATATLPPTPARTSPSPTTTPSATASAWPT